MFLQPPPPHPWLIYFGLFKARLSLSHCKSKDTDLFTKSLEWQLKACIALQNTVSQKYAEIRTGLLTSYNDHFSTCTAEDCVFHLLTLLQHCLFPSKLLDLAKYLLLCLTVWTWYIDKLDRGIFKCYTFEMYASLSVSEAVLRISIDSIKNPTKFLLYKCVCVYIYVYIVNTVVEEFNSVSAAFCQEDKIDVHCWLLLAAFFCSKINKFLLKKYAL